jgi:hypothetical protein
MGALLPSIAVRPYHLQISTIMSQFSLSQSIYPTLVVILVFRQKNINDSGFDTSSQWTAPASARSRPLGSIQFARSKTTGTIRSGTTSRTIGSRPLISSMTDIELQGSRLVGINTGESQTCIEEPEDLNGKDFRRSE